MKFISFGSSLRDTFFFKQVKCAILYIIRFVLLGMRTIYVRFYVIPFLFYKENLRKPFTVLNTFHSVVIVEKNRVFKVAVGTKSTIALELDNLELIQKTYPKLLAVFPEYSMCNHAFIRYITTPCYDDVDIQANMKFAVEIFKIISKHNKSRTKLKIEECGELMAGLNVISQVYDDLTKKKVQQVIDLYLEHGSYHVGLAHGDFHSRNIVIDKNHNPRLIDLDCIRFHGIQELDAFYFMMEKEWLESGRDWYEVIVRYLEGEISTELISNLDEFGIEYDIGLAVTYFVDRLGQENLAFGLNYSHEQLSGAINGIVSNQLVQY